MKANKFVLYFLMVIVGVQARAREVSDSTDIMSIISSIAKERHSHSAKFFNNGGIKYQTFSKDEAEVLYLFGILTSFDGACLHPVNRNAYKTSAVDSIITWYDRHEYLLEVDSQRKWLDWQREFYDYIKTPEYTYGFCAAMFQNWNDSIPDPHLKEIFLDGDDTLIDELFSCAWQELPALLQKPWQELVQLLPDSEFIKAKLKWDFLQYRYFSLENKFKKERLPGRTGE